MKKPTPGDEIIIKTPQGKEQGTLLESHDPGLILIKLKTGYNIGIKKKNIESISVVKEASKQEKEKAEIKMQGKPIIDFYITGGTISSKLDPKTGGVKDLTTPNEFFSMYPEIRDKIDLRIKKPFTKWSENMDSVDWIRLAKQITESLSDHNVQGVIVTHGTDFLHYTAAALSFFIQDLNKPVVLTYSQRSTDRGSSDARLNLLCAAQAALSNIAEVILVGHASTNDDYCYALRGTKVRKMHTSRRDAFRPINCQPIAKVWPDKIEYLSQYKKKSKNQIKLDAVFNSKIALLKFYPGQSPDILDYYAKKGYKGLVIEMSGLGHVITEGKNNWIPKLNELNDKGIVICASPQTLYGRLDPYVYESARRILKTGVIYLEDILPETALVKLGWVLGKKREGDEIKKLMLKNISGEFNKRLGESFLY
jgi:glutamyl-tRNA(Gln) amidotransferase subunit D